METAQSTSVSARPRSAPIDPQHRPVRGSAPARSLAAALAGASGPGRLLLFLGLATLVGLGGCVTEGDFLKLQEKVMDYHREEAKEPDPFVRIAQLAADVDAMRADIARLEGELEVARKSAEDALAEAKRARQALAEQQKAVAQAPAEAGVVAASSGEEAEATEAVPEEGPEGADADAIREYKLGLEARRSDDFDGCIDRFKKFLQTYSSSPYADDAAYWMADCYFKKGEFRVAVLRFNDVVQVYPTGNKAPDALYRQGESLLKLGPGFYDAAKEVFGQVIKQYPESDRAKDAGMQLERIGSG